MAGDTAAPPPPYWIAGDELWIYGPGGNVRVHQAGDRVSHARVVQHGWQHLVTDPDAAQDEDAAPAGDDPAAPAETAPAASGSQDRATAPAVKTTSQPPASSTSDSGPAAEGATT